MSIEERLKYAEAKLEEVISNGTIAEVTYWNGYIDGIRAVKRDMENG